MIIATGTDFESLTPMTINRNLPAGTIVTLQMTTTSTYGWWFNSPLAEPAFREKLAEAPVEVEDVWYRYGYGWARLRTTAPTTIAGMVNSEGVEGRISLGFLGWLAVLALIAIGAVLIGMAVSFIRVMAAATDAVVDLPKPILAALGVGGIVLGGVFIYKWSQGRSFSVSKEGFQTKAEPKLLTEGRG